MVMPFNQFVYFISDIYLNKEDKIWTGTENESLKEFLIYCIAVTDNFGFCFVIHGEYLL